MKKLVAANPFRRKLRLVRGRPETGAWLRAVKLDQEQELQSILGLMARGGRFNPPGQFPILHAAEDDERCRERMLQWIRDEQEPDGTMAVIVLKVKLSRVLDLTSGATRRRLGITLRELNNSRSSQAGQQIGAAAHDAGFEGIIYPRPLKPRRRNLALFMDRINAKKSGLMGRIESEAA
ncbi:MAG TPA: RES family NAD+ phosphorylase [Planctomycetota bacterium]|jgi:RES domain-containing protein|nr:RES family NAD+ phosphorylase [Planctomycetota bacterium]